jgi:outer membrane protein assembly factor BamD (BamD/ComL family)
MPEGVPHARPLPQRAVRAGSAPATRLAKQLAALNAVHAALTAGDPTGALALLDQFEHRNPSSPLDEEVAVLRIDALVDAGRRAEARERAAAFLSGYPASAYSQRVRSKVTSP